MLFLKNKLSNLHRVFTKLKLKQYPNRKCKKKKKVSTSDSFCLIASQIWSKWPVICKIDLVRLISHRAQLFEFTKFPPYFTWSTSIWTYKNEKLKNTKFVWFIPSISNFLISTFVKVWFCFICLFHSILFYFVDSCCFALFRFVFHQAWKVCPFLLAIASFCTTVNYLISDILKSMFWQN